MVSNRILSFIAGLILALVGIYLFFVPSVDLFSLSWLLALAFLVGAMAEIIRYFSTDKSYRNIWLLLAAIISGLFGLYLLYGYFLTLPIIVPTVVGFWILLLGFVRLFQSFGTSSQASTAAKQLWHAVGMIILGVVLMFNPLLASIIVAYVVAITLIYQGFVLMIMTFKP